MQPVGGANYSRHARLPCEPQLWSESPALAGEMDWRQMIHFARRHHRRITQSVTHCEVLPYLPLVAGEILLLEPAEAPMPVSNCGRVPARHSHSEIRDRVTPIIRAKVVISPLARGLEAIVSQPVYFGPRRQYVVPHHSPVQHRIPKPRDPPVD